MSQVEKSLWELLWDYDPNGLVAIDESGTIRVVNPAFCRLFRVTPESALGQPAEPLLGEMTVFEEVRQSGESVLDREVNYADLDIYVRQVIFPVHDHGLVACINVDLSRDYSRRAERRRIEQEMIANAQHVVNNQMKVAQEIASLLGETTAETKASLLELIRAMKAET